MMRKFGLLVIALIVVLALVPPQNNVSMAQEPSDNPVWLFLGCYGNWGTATLAWFNPSEEVLPFTSYFPGNLYILAEGYGESEILSYIGGSTCPMYPGCVYYRWRAVYDIPPAEFQDYYLAADIVNDRGEAFAPVPNTYYPGCTLPDITKVYMPLVAE